MQLNRPLCLPADAWNDLTSRLSHVSDARRQKTDAFLEEISQNVQVTRNGRRILVESNNLDESAILALLQPKSSPPDAALSAGVSRSYSIHIHFSMDSDSFPFLGNQSASESPYQACAAPSDQFYSMETGCRLMSA